MSRITHPKIVADEYPEAIEVVNRLNAIMKTEYPGDAYINWCEGEGPGEKFHTKFTETVKNFFGHEVFEEMKQLERVLPYLLFRLGLGPDNSKG